MKKILALIAICTLMVSCTEGKKTAADLASNALSTAVVKELECSNADAVKADVTTQIDKILKIQAETSGSAASMFCGDLVALAVPKLVDAGIPDAWGCTAANAKEKLATLADKACEKL